MPLQSPPGAGNVPPEPDGPFRFHPCEVLNQSGFVVGVVLCLGHGCNGQGPRAGRSGALQFGLDLLAAG